MFFKFFRKFFPGSVSNKEISLYPDITKPVLRMILLLPGGSRKVRGFYRKGVKRLHIFSVAFFIFFSAAAGAGVVSADFGFIVNDLFNLALRPAEPVRQPADARRGQTGRPRRGLCLLTFQTLLVLAPASRRTLKIISVTLSSIVSSISSKSLKPSRLYSVFGSCSAKARSPMPSLRWSITYKWSFQVLSKTCSRTYLSRSLSSPRKNSLPASRIFCFLSSPSTYGLLA